MISWINSLLSLTKFLLYSGIMCRLGMTGTSCGIPGTSSGSSGTSGRNSGMPIAATGWLCCPMPGSSWRCIMLWWKCSCSSEGEVIGSWSWWVWWWWIVLYTVWTCFIFFTLYGTWITTFFLRLWNFGSVNLTALKEITISKTVKQLFSVA